MRKLRKGFTIVELVIVIAVIAVLTAILVPTFIHLAKKAKESSDKSLVHNLNTALKVDEADGNATPQTMQDAVEALDRQGYRVPQLATKSGQDLVYNVENNEFYLSSDVEGDHINYWHVQSNAVNPQGWSIYAFEWFSSEATGLTVGFDAGICELSKVSYLRGSSDAAQSVLIRTNSADTELIIDAQNDTVKHHGNVGTVHVIAVDSLNCYDEHGRAAFTQVDSGKYKTSAGSDVELLYVSNSSVSLEIVSGTVDHAHASSEEAAATLNANSQGVIFDYDGNDAQEGLDVHHHVAEEDKINLSADYTENKSNDSVVEAVDKVAAEQVAENPNADKFVARIGAKGYESFKNAANSAKPGEKIYLLKDFVVGEDIGELSQVPGEWWIGGLRNEVVLTDDITITFVGPYQLQFNEGAKINMNGHKLKLMATTENAGLFLVEIDEELDIAMSESGAVLTLTHDIEYISTATLNNFVKFDGETWITSSQIGVGGADPVVGPGPNPDIWG